MNRNTRRNKSLRSETRNKIAHVLSSVSKNRSPSGLRVTKDPDKPRVNRCCLVHPKQKDFGQIIKLGDAETISVPGIDRYTSIISEQFGFNPIQAKLKTKVKGINVFCGDAPKVENSSQYNYIQSTTGSKFVETSDGTQWQSIDNINEIDKYIQPAIHEESPYPIECHRKPANIHISEVPRVKIILEKFSKFKRHNVELRRLDEKVVCVEYDIYDYDSPGIVEEPIQTMRVFFSVKPNYENCESGTLPLTELPSNIKHNFNIMDEDLKKLTVKEIEIIDDSIEKNRCYLDDLKRILKRQHFIKATKGKSSIDLNTLYEIARREKELFCSEFTNASLFSKAELQEFKELIMQRCKSSVHGINRRRLKSANENKIGEGILSGSIVSALLT